jgi:hypothetical protein
MARQITQSIELSWYSNIRLDEEGSRVALALNWAKNVEVEHHIKVHISSCPVKEILSVIGLALNMEEPPPPPVVYMEPMVPYGGHPETPSKSAWDTKDAKWPQTNKNKKDKLNLKKQVFYINCIMAAKALPQTQALPLLKALPLSKVLPLLKALPLPKVLCCHFPTGKLISTWAQVDPNDIIWSQTFLCDQVGDNLIPNIVGYKLMTSVWIQIDAFMWDQVEHKSLYQFQFFTKNLQVPNCKIQKQLIK